MPAVATPEVLSRPRIRTFRFGNLFTVTGLAVVVKVAGAAKSAACARFFGIDRALDCYLVAFGLASLICDTMAGSLTPALLPVCSSIEANVSPREYCNGYGWMLYPPAILLAAAAALLMTVDRSLYSFVAPGFSVSEVQLTHKLLCLMAPMLPVFAVIAVFRALLNNYERFRLAALAPVLTPVAIIALLAAGSRQIGIETVAVGTALGAVAEAAVLAFGVRRLGFSLLPGFAFKLPANWFKRQYMPLLASGFVGGSRVAVDQAVAATLGPGGVSALNLGTRLISVVGGIIPAALGTVIMPRLSRVAARKGWEELRQYAIRIAVSSALCACFIAGVLAMLSRPIADLLFQRGASLHLDIALLAHIQTISLTQLPFLFGVAILTRTALVRASGRMLMLMSVGSAAANLGLDILCARSMGITGVVLATTLVQIVSTALLLPSLRKSGAD